MVPSIHFDDLRDVIAKTHQGILEEKRPQFERWLEGTLLNAEHELIGRIAKEACKNANGHWPDIRPSVQEARSKTEHRLRRLNVRDPSTPQEFEAGVKWMAENGDEGDRRLLMRVKERPPTASGDSAELIDSALLKMRQRHVGTTKPGSDDAGEVMREAESAYERNRLEWERDYRGQFIGVHAGTVVASSTGESDLERKLIAMQREKGRFQAVIIEVGAPILTARGPRIRLRPRRAKSAE